jgi:thiamine-phosphate pyrophosphorylase
VILHLVTDWRRLVPSGSDAERDDCIVRQARHASEAGIDVIHVRERDLEAGHLARLVSAVLAVTRKSATRVVVNDRLDVALACGADGVHLRADSIDAAAVRGVAPPGFLIGRSVHTVDDVATAGPVDYLVAGTVWATVSKPAGPPLLGIEGLRDIAARSPVPVLAIGGVDVRNLADVASAGAAGVAAIGAFLAPEPEPPACRAMPLVDVAKRMRDTFDTFRPRS